MGCPPAPRPFPFALLAPFVGSYEVRTLHVNGRTLRLMKEQGLTWRQADACAVRVGMHPAEIWPDWCDVALSEVS